jgi:hypothetical protein
MIPVIIPYIRHDVKWTVFYHCKTDMEILYALCCLLEHRHSATQHIVIGEYCGLLANIPPLLVKMLHRHLIPAERRPMPSANERHYDMLDIEIDQERFCIYLEALRDADLHDIDEFRNRVATSRLNKPQ